jgi:SAM-dependent MidA family methyltransferase
VIELRRKIEAEIADHGPIPFSRYMEMCLYDPDFGYYARNASQFGKAGDFYTSSDVHAVFGRLLARQFEEMWRVLGSPEPFLIMELGTGRGLFARDVLDWSEKKFPDFFRSMHFYTREDSPALAQHTEGTLKRHFESGKASSLSVNDKLYNMNVVFANEFFDALPVRILSTQGSLHLDARAGRFVEVWLPASDEELEFLDRYSVHPQEGERIEVPLNLLAGLTFSLDQGFVVIIDYGYTREEQLAGRHRGTLKAIRQHSVSANPYEAPGEQDITADVNFTALAALAEQHGFQVQKLITQSQFLMGIGEANQFADAFEDCRLPQERAKVALQLKHLVTPAGMGESFHVLVASKGVDVAKASGLAGLSFERR